MDHEHHHGHGETDDDNSCPMMMVFHGGHCERILWKGWVASSITEFVFSALAFFLIAFLYEALKYVREHLLRKAARQYAERMAHELQAKNGGCHSDSATAGQGCSNGALPERRESTYLQRIFGAQHLIQTLLNLMQIIISYLLMLVFMNYNYWLCLAVIAGLGLGYFFFGWAKQDVYEGECCP